MIQFRFIGRSLPSFPNCNANKRKQTDFNGCVQTFNYCFLLCSCEFLLPHVFFPVCLQVALPSPSAAVNPSGKRNVVVSDSSLPSAL